MGRFYRDLVAWQIMDLVTATYRATAGFPRDELFGLTAQLRRAAVSIPSNIAEGEGRLSEKEFRYFLGQARGSLNGSGNANANSREPWLFAKETNRYFAEKTLFRSVEFLMAYWRQCQSSRKRKTGNWQPVAGKCFPCR
jgi:hypothetical protein